MPEVPGSLSNGQIFHNRYEVVRCLKIGGMGAVYECIHLKTRKRCALKVMLPQILAGAGMRERFELEARVTAEVESEHIVETFDAGVDEATGAPFLVMELLRGEDLGSTLKRRGPLTAAEAVILLTQAALALDKTHAAGIVHRDLKPDNLFVTARDDGSPRLKVLDFGIAKVVADSTQSAHQTATIGTPLYMSQEQILGEGTIGPRADLYALAHIAFALLTGAPYWLDEQKSTPAIYTFLGKVMAGPVEPPTKRAARRGVTLPPTFDPWFMRATAKDAKDRFERASIMIQDLAAVLSVPVSRPVVSGLHSLQRPVVDATVVLHQPAPLAAPSELPAPTMSEGTTVVATSKSVKTSPERLIWPFIVVAFGVIGLGVFGLFWFTRRSATMNPSTKPTIGQDASSAKSQEAAVTTVTPAVTQPDTKMGAPEPAPTLPPSVTGTSSNNNAPATSASSKPAQPRVKPVQNKPVAPDVCDPPYVLDSEGRRRMKPECL